MSGKLKIEENIIQIIIKSIESLQSQGVISVYEIPEIQVEVPKDQKFGDFSVNIAMKMAKNVGMKPRDLAELIISHMDVTGSYIRKTEIAGPGFINITLDHQWLWDELKAILELKENYGKIVQPTEKSINVEYVSANPTGPLHIGNARGGAIGDVLANVYTWAGWNVTKEFYLNDAGNQIIKFGESLSARYLQLFDESVIFPEDGYQGEDIKDIAVLYKNSFGDKLIYVSKEEREETLIQYGLEININNMRRDLENYGIQYDVWFSESTLHVGGAINDILKLLKERGVTYEKDGAVWFKATDFECEKDEVLVRENGIPTYYTADIAYHFDKLIKRKFDMSVDVWGADHHGHVHRLKMALKAAGIDPERLHVILMQLVFLVRDGEQVRFSKRKGEIVTLRDLIDDVGTDAARFIFNHNNASTHLNFDLDLAVKQSNENPVFYVQYANARINSIIRNVTIEERKYDLSVLTDQAEIALLKKMASFSEEIYFAARDYDPSRITKYAFDLATCFHSFYNACRVKCEDEELMGARMKLVTACGYLLKNTLAILGVSAPEQM